MQFGKSKVSSFSLWLMSIVVTLALCACGGGGGGGAPSSSGASGSSGGGSTDQTTAVVTAGNAVYVATGVKPTPVGAATVYQATPSLSCLAGATGCTVSISATAPAAAPSTGVWVVVPDGVTNPFGSTGGTVVFSGCTGTDLGLTTQSCRVVITDTSKKAVTTGTVSGGAFKRDAVADTGPTTPVVVAPPADAYNRSLPTLPGTVGAVQGVYAMNSQLEQTNYHYAHIAGAIGTGVTVAVVDTGVAPSSKFENRLLPGIDVSNPDATGNKDVNGHGTFVAGILAGANTAVTVGVAPGASVVSIRVFDDTGYGDALTFKTGVVNSGALNAKIYNASLGSSFADTRFTDTLQWIKDNGKLMVLSAGNAGGVNPLFPAVNASSYGGSVIAVGAVTSAGTLASYSNKAGTAKDYYLVAPGDYYDSISANGIKTGMQGTSMAAPVVSGAAAIVWGLWPYLKATDVSNILLVTAKDLGAPGVDDVFGHGLLDLKAALSPIGSLKTVTAQGSTVTAGQPLVNSSSLGMSALKSTSVEAVYFDTYKRAFSVPVNQAVNFGTTDYSAAVSSGLARMTATSAQAAKVGSHFSMAADFASQGAADAEYLVNATQGSSQFALFDGNKYLPFAQNGMLQGTNAFAGEALKNPYLSLTEKVRGYSFTTDLGHGASLTAGSLNGPDKTGAALETSLVQGKWTDGRSELTVQAGTQVGTSAFAGVSETGSSGVTSFQSFSASFAPVDKWWLMSSFTQGTASVKGLDVISGGSVTTQALSFGIVKEEVFSQKDRMGFSVTQPNRIVSGEVELTLPVSVTDTGAAVYGKVPVSLVPTGHETVMELAWSVRTKLGDVGASVSRRFQPNSDADAAPVSVLGVTWHNAF